MLDIYGAVAILSLLSLATFVGAHRMARHWSARPRAVALSIVIGAVVAFTMLIHDRLSIARFLPVSSAVILGNITPMLAAAIAALVWSVPGPGKLRRAVLLGVLFIVTGRMLYLPLMGGAPQCGNTWEGDVCLQTTDASCAAAAAATLLRHHGVDTTETEMADLCLTRRGTLRLGLYRGLRLKAPPGRRVEVIRGDVPTLRGVATEPVIIFVGLRRGKEADPRYARDWGWTPGLRHAVVLFGFTDDGRIDIGDPTFGREKWEVGALDVLWDGYALRLAAR